MKIALLGLVLSLSSISASAFADDYNCVLRQQNEDGTNTVLQSYKGAVDMAHPLFTEGGKDYKAYSAQENTLELEILKAGTLESLNAAVASSADFLALVDVGSSQKTFQIFSCWKMPAPTK